MPRVIALAESFPAAARVPLRQGDDELVKELKRRGDYARLAEIWLDRAAAEPRGRRRARCLAELARLFDQDLREPERALTAALAAYRAHPRPRAWPDLHRLAAATGRFGELAAELERAMPNLTPRSRADAWVHIGRIHELWLGRPKDAMAYYRRSIACQPQRVAGLLALGGLLGQGATGELQALLTDPSSAPLEERVALRRELATLHLERGDTKSAIRDYEELLVDAPGDLAAWRELARLHEKQGALTLALRALEALVGLVEDPVERVALYHRMAAAHETLSAAAQAVECLEWVLSFEPRDAQAFRSLERLYVAGGRWRAAVDVLCRHAQLAKNPERDQLYLEVAQLYDTRIRDAARAAEFFARIEAPDERVLSALSRLYEELEQSDRLAETLERRARSAPAPEDAARLQHRAAELYARMGDALQAERLYFGALELCPSQLDSRLRLAELLVHRGEAARGAALVEESLAQAKEPGERARLLVALGRMAEADGARARAEIHYQDALTEKPDDDAAAAHLETLLRGTGRERERLPLLVELVRRDAPTPIRVERLCQLGDAAQAVDELERALDAYTAAAALDPLHLPAERARALLLARLERHTEAYAALQGLKEARGTQLTPPERIELLHALATAALKVARPEDARRHVDEILRQRPGHAGALALLSELVPEPEALVQLKWALLASAPREDMPRLLMEIGDLYATGLGDPRQALDSYRDALELTPEDHRLLHRCLDLLVECHRWTEACAILERLITIERSATVRARYRLAMAMICREELGRWDEALVFSEAALDDDPALDRAADAIEEILRDRGDFAGLQAHLCRLIKRVGPDAPVPHHDRHLRSWSQLADLCLHELKDPESALAALTVVVRLAPENVTRRVQLADLHVQAGPDHLCWAIAEHQAILRLDPGRVDSYEALEELYSETGRVDRAAACARAAQVVARTHRAEPPPLVAPGEAAPAIRPLDQASCAKLIHPSEDRLVSALFATVSPLFVTLHARSFEQVGLKPSEAVAPDDGRPFARAAAHTARLLGVPFPRLFVRRQQTTAFEFLNVRSNQTLVPTFTCGLPLLGDRRSEGDLVFQLAHKLVNLRRDRILRMVLPDDGHLAHIVRAGIALAGGDQLSAPLRETVQWLKANLSPIDLDQVTTIGSRLAERHTDADELVAAWLVATERTAGRIALVLTGELERAATIYEALDPGRAQSRIIDLAWSSITEEFFCAREQLTATVPGIG